MTTGACTVAAEVGVKMTATAAAKLDLRWLMAVAAAKLGGKKTSESRNDKFLDSS
jgi:hypothetical protein